MAHHNIAIACQGGGSHAAYAAGALAALLPRFDPLDIRSVTASTPLTLAGLSGTSGGAITALLGWYGYLTGGAIEAERKLTTFWDANTARMPGESLFNTWSLSVADAMPYDLKLSPYLSPLRETEYLAGVLWPLAVDVFGHRLEHWVRSSYFSLAEMIRPHVDFELVEALGDFLSIPLDVQRWRAVDLEARVYDNGAPRGHELAETRHQIEQRIARKFGRLGAVQERLQADAVRPDALLPSVLRSWSPPHHLRFDSSGLRDLSGRIDRIAAMLPQLLIGAVEIDHGRFTAFSSERAPTDGGISLEAVLASAALPWIFRAQGIRQLNPVTNRMEMRAYWDGLFSQNPPIRDFLSGMGEERKPDGIWVVQINPNDFHTQEVARGVSATAFSGTQIWHTRDALAGNLSLNQELGFIHAINRRVASGANREERADKHIQINRIVMDGGAIEATLGGRKLGAHSKLDRAADLKDALMAHGREQGMRFLALRSEIERASASLGSMLRGLAAPANEPGTLTGVLPSIREDEGVRDAHLIVDELTVQHTSAQGAGEDVLANVHWHTLGAHLDGTQIRIEGNTGLYRGGRAGHNWRLRNVVVETPTHLH